MTSLKTTIVIKDLKEFFSEKYGMKKLKHINMLRAWLKVVLFANTTKKTDKKIAKNKKTNTQNKKKPTKPKTKNNTPIHQSTNKNNTDDDYTWNINNFPIPTVLTNINSSIIARNLLLNLFSILCIIVLDKKTANNFVGSVLPLEEKALYRLWKKFRNKILLKYHTDKVLLNDNKENSIVCDQIVKIDKVNMQDFQHFKIECSKRILKITSAHIDKSTTKYSLKKMYTNANHQTLYMQQAI